jgi:hypothetical protein
MPSHCRQQALWNIMYVAKDEKVRGYCYQATRTQDGRHVWSFGCMVAIPRARPLERWVSKAKTVPVVD